ncbi:MAG: carboxypeptidase-like regulatory domain-containing protein [Bacteroidota bacterium]|nr:carboxypeptidase-like regulatory domain-containing protein [Bacteroidota bacterium]
MQRLFLLYIIIFGCIGIVKAQHTVEINGRVVDEMHKPIPFANVIAEGQAVGTSTNQAGKFSLKITAKDSVYLNISSLGYKEKTFYLAVESKKTLELFAVLTLEISQLPTATIEDTYDRKSGLTRLNPKNIESIPNTSGFESILKTLPGVSSQNEMSSQYNVRGGNFDENLVYVNDVQIYRPFLVRSGQQEGLSFINSDLVSSVVFSAGGFDATYGDKLSSVLDIKYKKPRETQASLSASMLGGSVHAEGSNKNGLLTYLMGARYKTNRYLLGTLDTEGEYNPDFADIQTLISYDFSDEFEMSFLGHFSQNTYRFVPEDKETSFGTINESYKLKIYFDGQEKNSFTTGTGAVTGRYHKQDKLEMKFIASGFYTMEKERFDILGQYFLNNLETNLGEEDTGDSISNAGVGSFLNHANNNLNTGVFNFKHKGELITDGHKLYWGGKYQFEDIDYILHEWQMIDSAGYSLPYSDEEVFLYHTDTSNFDIYSHRASLYVMDKYAFDIDSAELDVSAGLRANYWTFNNQFLLSPRIVSSVKPQWEKDFVFRLSGGLYHQPPFFKEIIKRDGSINHDIKAQSSAQVVLGSDYVFKAWDRPFKLVTELYYKYLYNLIPYEIDNVRIRYYGENIADGYSTGIDIKLNGEFVKGTESWFSLSLMQTKEDIQNDAYREHYDEEGNIMSPHSGEQPDTSIMIEPGYIPRPTDQRVSAAIYFQDYLPGNPTWKVHLNLVYGTGLPFGPPNSERYMATGRMPDYRRVDLGISKQIITTRTNFPEASPLHYIKDFWISLELFNLFDINNTISHIWVSDIYGRQYAVPNYLTGRRVNLKINLRF